METTIINEDKIQIVEMQPIIKETYSLSELKQELESINSEIKNFVLIQDRRMQALVNRKEKLESFLLQINNAAEMKVSEIALNAEP